MLTFTNWTAAQKAECYTKTQLSKMQPSRKAINLEVFDAIINSGGNKYVLYHINNTVFKRVSKASPPLEMNPQNIAESLYTISKSAKISRDTKGMHYKQKNYAIVKRAKRREQDLYTLKDAVFNLLLKNGQANIVGYHTQTHIFDNSYWIYPEECEDTIFELENFYLNFYGQLNEMFYAEMRDIQQQYTKEHIQEIETIVSYLALVEFSGFTFHIPTTDINDLENLGEINIIPATSKRKKVTLKLALDLLDRYLKKEEQLT